MQLETGQIFIDVNHIYCNVILAIISGGLALAVEGPSKAEIQCVDNKDGTCTVTYYPTVPGEYTVVIKFADKHINGSPFTAKITGPRE